MAALFINRVRDIQDYRLFILFTIFTIFCLDKIFSPYFPFHNVGRSVSAMKKLARWRGKDSVLCIIIVRSALFSIR